MDVLTIPKSTSSVFPPGDAGRTPLVLVGIVTRNRASILPKAIQSALSQTYPNLEIAVLDDGSTDGTYNLQSVFPTVHWYKWECSRGYLEARNLLMRTTNAGYFVSLDDDAWFLSDDATQLAIEYMEATPTVAAVAFDIISPDRPDSKLRTGPRPTSTFVGCGHVLRIAAVRDSGFYVPSPGFYGSEEKDLCLRFLDRRWDIHFLPGVHVWHDKTAVARNQAEQHRSGVCNDLVFVVRRCPLLLMLIVIPGKIFQHLRFAVRNRLLRPCLSGFYLFLRNARVLWGGRSPVRTGSFMEFLRRSRES